MDFFMINIVTIFPHLSIRYCSFQWLIFPRNQLIKKIKWVQKEAILDSGTSWQFIRHWFLHFRQITLDPNSSGRCKRPSIRKVDHPYVRIDQIGILTASFIANFDIVSLQPNAMNSSISRNKWKKQNTWKKRFYNLE